MNIYEYFNSCDIAEHCRTIGFTPSAIETAYLIWHSNHHTLSEKHTAWQEIIDTMPDESFSPDWDFDGLTLHGFLRAFMRLQNEFIKDFYTAKGKYVYTYSVLSKRGDQFRVNDTLFANYESCLDTLTQYELDDEEQNDIRKVRITRHKLYSRPVSFLAAKKDSIILDNTLHLIDIEPDLELKGERKFLAPIYGFYEMRVAIPTPFRKGDIVTDVETYDEYSPRRIPFILESIPYWSKNSNDSDDCNSEIARVLNLGVDYTDMQVGVYFQNAIGEIFWDHGFHYLNLEYYRDEPEGVEKFLVAVSSAMQGKISAEELLRSHSVILLEQHAFELRKYYDNNQELLRLCGIL